MAAVGLTADTLCLDCAGPFRGDGAACPTCFSRRVVRHPELFRLAIAHVDCDAFFASVEKARRPELAGRPVLVGGGERGVVTTACYVARMSGAGSAMPMRTALRLCPDAVVIRPDFAAYGAVSRRIRAMLETLTPLVRPLSIDEAVVDLAGTEALHAAPPAVVLARFAIRVERELGVTVSIGLAPNRLLAKLAAGRDKPRGFSVLGEDARAWLAGQPVRLLPGIGPAEERRLHARGFFTLGQIQALDERSAIASLGPDGRSLVHRARGHGDAVVAPGGAARSAGTETTFATDLASFVELEAVLWRIAETLSGRLRRDGVAAGGFTLKLKTSRFATRTRAGRLAAPTSLAETLFEAARPLLRAEADGTAFRLVGLTARPLVDGALADRDDLADATRARRARAQNAIDDLRARYGRGSIVRGRVF